MVSLIVVEDNKNLRMLMSDRLEMEGYKIFQAENGEGALEIMDEHKIDLLISDIMMPSMDGYELTDTLRQACFNMPILMIQKIPFPHQLFRVMLLEQI